MRKGVLILNVVSKTVDPTALAAKQKLSAQFLKKGIAIALISGLMYGFYSAFLTLGMKKGRMG